MLKCIIWLYVFELFSCHFQNSKPLENLDEERDEVSLYFCIYSASVAVDSLSLPSKGCYLIQEISPRDKSLSTGIESLENLVKLPLVASSLIS